LQTRAHLDSTVALLHRVPPFPPRPHAAVTTASWAEIFEGQRLVAADRRHARVDPAGVPHDGRAARVGLRADADRLALAHVQVDQIRKTRREVLSFPDLGACAV